MSSEAELQTFLTDLVSTHFVNAIYFYCNAKNFKHIITRRGYYISSIIHSVSAVEASANRLAYQIFENDKSGIYIPTEKRDIPLKRMYNSWANVLTVDKINLILSLLKIDLLEASLENRFRELNNLRNWLVHGFCYETTYLLDNTGEDSFDLVDYEESVDWSKKFPNTKFSAIDKINETDANKALTIVLEVLVKLIKTGHLIVSILIERNGKIKFRIINEETTLDGLIKDV